MYILHRNEHLAVKQTNQTINMNGTIYSVITGTGNYIPSRCIKNEDFLTNEFYDTDGKKLEKTN